jgi:predicted outer membrane repeat protein
MTGRSRGAVSALASAAVMMAGACAARTSVILVPRVLLVPEEYATIQSAVDAAVDGDTILVAPGTYRESILWTGKAIALLGAGPGVTIVDPSSPGPGGRCLTMTDVPAGGKVAGFTCQNATAADLDSPSGGGALIQGGSPALERMAFVDDEATFGGGGTWIDGSHVTLTEVSFVDDGVDLGEGGIGSGLGITHGSWVEVVRATFSGNFAEEGGGIWIDTGSTLTMEGSLFQNDGAKCGGGIRSSDSTVSVSGSLFTGNVADNTGAAICTEGGSVTVLDSTFDGNVSDFPVLFAGALTVARSVFTRNTGGGITSGGPLTVLDCWFENNAASEGGAIVASGSASVTRSVFRDNTANGDGVHSPVRALGGAIYAGGDTSVTECVFQGNTAQGGKGPNDGGAIYVSGSVTVQQSTLCGDSPDEIGGPGAVAVTDSVGCGG